MTSDSLPRGGKFLLIFSSSVRFLPLQFGESSSARSAAFQDIETSPQQVSNIHMNFLQECTFILGCPLKHSNHKIAMISKSNVQFIGTWMAAAASASGAPILRFMYVAISLVSPRTAGDIMMKGSRCYFLDGLLNIAIFIVGTNKQRHTADIPMC